MAREIKIENLRPVSDRVVVIPDAKADQTESGVLIPKEAKKNNHILTGEVVAVGPGKPDNPMIVKKGDIIMYPEHVGTEISGGLLIMQEAQILSII